MDKAVLFDAVKGYLEGALQMKFESDFGRGYSQGLQSLQDYIKTLENSPFLLEQLSKKAA